MTSCGRFLVWDRDRYGVISHQERGKPTGRAKSWEGAVRDRLEKWHPAVHEASWWDGRQIVSRQWVVGEATTAQIRGMNVYEDYGYGWYVAPETEETS